MKITKEKFINKPIDAKFKGFQWPTSSKSKWAMRQVLWNLFESVELKCSYCGFLFDLTIMNNKLTLDHIIPITKNGSKNIKNLAPCCEKCNKKKAFRVWKVKFTNLHLD